ncbi:hypothetical protein D3C83_112320 [compost metagenome]
MATLGFGLLLALVLTSESAWTGGPDGMPVERVAEAAGTVGYQLLCALAPRVRIVEK